MSQQMLLPLSLLGALAGTAGPVTILKITLDRPRLASCGRWGLAAQHVDHPLRRDHLSSRSRQKARPAMPAEAERTAVAADVERTQNPKVHANDDLGDRRR